MEVVLRKDSIDYRPGGFCTVLGSDSFEKKIAQENLPRFIARMALTFHRKFLGQDYDSRLARSKC